ncbi:hypothetical protein EDC30_10314 [Paucimonas lemoignei]|uniref:Uncharacterized protein n=1 Tax=Paucimonas lemoignei TaxID=29443 RepID=A0A4R3HX31_PAULE|nr:hypothetical protein [Paucimonas lemoignei]TCS37722.1 hypothetical protein EDC30_10314 [Paucimonas lemoignei]
MMNEIQTYRMVALKLHGLHPKDRKWILGQFEPNQQNILRDLLKELDSLGLVTTEDLATNFSSHSVGDVQLAEDLIQNINQADVELVKRQLSSLPDRLKAMLLYAHQWEWSSTVWLSLEQSERDRLSRQIDQCHAIKAAAFSALAQFFADELTAAWLTSQSDKVAARVG